MGRGVCWRGAEGEMTQSIAPSHTHATLPTHSTQPRVGATTPSAPGSAASELGERARRGAIRVRSLSRQPPHLAVVMCSAAFTTHSAKMVSPPAAQNPRANDGRREEVPTTWAINHAPCGDTFTSFSSASSAQCLHSKQWPCFHAALECRTRLDLRRRTQL